MNGAGVYAPLQGKHTNATQCDRAESNLRPMAGEALRRIRATLGGGTGHESNDEGTRAPAGARRAGVHAAGTAGGDGDHRPACRLRRPALFRADRQVRGQGGARADDSLEKALDQYRLDTGHYPTQEHGIGALIKKPANEPRWDGPYLKKDLPLDPWGKAYLYKIPGEKGDFDLVSYGKDGVPGGTGESADLRNN